MGSWPDYDPAFAFRMERTVQADEIDAYGHVNDAVYLAWLHACAWAHAEAMGFGVAAALAEGRGLAVRSALLDYLGSARLGEQIVVATWITENDGKLLGARRFDVSANDKRILRGRIDYVMLNLATLKPVCMPARYDALLPIPPL